MFSDKNIALAVRNDMLEIMGKLDDSIINILNRCSEEEMIEYKRSIGPVMAEILCGIMIKIFDRYPDLKPDDYK